VLALVNSTALVAASSCWNEFWPPRQALVAAVAFGHRPYFGCCGHFQDDLASVVGAGCRKDNEKFQYHAYNEQTCMVATINCHEEDKWGPTTCKKSGYISGSTTGWKHKGCREATTV
jgi:hypothetical protein